MDRVTVPEAARILGIKEESVRKRVSRGTLRSDKDNAGRLLVYVDSTRTVRDNVRGPSEDVAREDLLASKDRLIEVLETQLAEEREARRRADTIIAQLTQANAALAARVPQLEPPTEAPGGPETATEQPGRVEPQTAVEGAQEHAQPRSWWRRMFR